MSLCTRSRADQHALSPLCHFRIAGWTLVLALAAFSPPASVGAQVPADPAIGALRDAIRRQSPELAARRAAVTASEARLRATGFAPAAVASAEVEEIPDVANIPNAGTIRLDLSREFLSGARRSAERLLAETELQSARTAVEVTERRLVAVADAALTRVIGWTAIARRLAEEDALLTSAEGSLRSRFVVGDVRYVDVLRVRTERLRIQTSRATAVSEATMGLRTLEGLLGADSLGVSVLRAMADSAALERRVALLSTSALLAAPAIDSLVARSATVLAAEADIARARAVHRLTLAEQRPRLGASLGAQRFQRDGDGFTLGPTIGASLSLPFTARRANAMASDAAQADIAAARAQYQAVVTTTRAALAAARDRYEAARIRLAVYETALLRGAREERSTALVAYTNNDLSLMELIDFERALARAEVDQLVARIEAAEALAALLGGTAEALEPAGARSSSFTRDP